MMRKEILIVCRHTHTLGALAQSLQQAGRPALTAQTAQDGWECIRGGTVGLVVLDLSTPALDAVLFFRAVRSSYSTDHIPFLFLYRKDFTLPVLSSFAGERVHDGWLAVPCPARQLGTLAQRLLEQAEKSGSRERTAPAAEPEAAKPSAQTPAPSAASPSKAAFAGQLGAIDVTRILGMLEPLKVTGVLNVNDGKREGQIHFVEGTVWHATLGDIEGADALFLLFHMKQGDFRFEEAPPAKERTIKGNTMSLLLEGMRQMDEAKGLIQEIQTRRRLRSGRHPPAGPERPAD